MKMVVPVSLEIENMSDGLIEEVLAGIRLKGWGRADHFNWTWKQRYTHNTVFTTAGPVPSGERANYNWTLPFDFSQAFIDSCMIPVSEAAELSRLIEFQYEVYVKLKRKGLTRNVEVTVPITVCTEN